MIGSQYKRRSWAALEPSRPWMGSAIKLNIGYERDRVVQVDLEIGYSHRGFEKSCEQDSYRQCLPRVGRLNGVSSALNEVSYCLAVEKLLKVEIPERASYLRVLACELSRMIDHLNNLGALGCQLGISAVWISSAQAKELLNDLMEGMAGVRTMASYARIGGVRTDLPDGFERIVPRHFKKVRKITKNIQNLLRNNRIFIDRMEHVGCVSKEVAVHCGTTGLFLRSAGVECDVRKDTPYLVYDRLDFDVPIGSAGDNLDRYRLRMEEIGQSMSLVEQALKKMPQSAASKREAVNKPIKAEQMADRGKAGYMQELDRVDAVYEPFNEKTGRRFSSDIASERSEVSLPCKESVYGSIEGMIRHFNMWMTGAGVAPFCGEAYGGVEGANGEAGFYVISDGTDRPFRVRFRSPLFPIVSALRTVLIGQDVADVLTVLVSANVMGDEFDR